MPDSTPLSSPVPVMQVAETAAQPPVTVGHVPQSLLPPNTANAGAVPSPREPQAVPPPSSAALPVEEEDVFELPALSQTALLFVTSPHYKESDMRMAQTFGLTEDDLSFLHEMDQMVLGGAMGVDGYIRAMRGEFPDWDDATRDAFIGQLVAERFLPWGERLKPSAKAASALEGLVLPHVSYYKVYSDPLTYTQAAEEVTKMVEIPLTTNMVRRLAELVKSRSKGVRVAEQAEAQLMRPMDQGGLGLQPEQARATVIAIGDLLARVALAHEDALQDRAPLETAPPSPSSTSRPSSAASSFASAPASAPSVSSAPTPSSATASSLDTDFVLDEQADAREVAAVAQTMPEVTSRAALVAEAVAAVMATLTGAPEDAYLVRRLENLVSTRLRDVRSRHEVLSTLSRGQKVGGLGLGRAEAERLAGQIEDGYAQWHERIAAEESLAREQYVREQAAKTEAQKKKEAAEHAAWFAERTRQQQALKKPAKKPLAPGAHPLDAREQAREEQSFGSLVQAPQKSMGVEDFLASLSVAPSLTMSSSAKAASAPSAKAPPPVPPPVQKKPQPPAVKISAASAKAAGAAPTRPRLDDVQDLRTGLVGPRQELERLTLGAFRRLGKTPEEAAAQVRNLVKLLEEQSFGKHVEGVRAWQESPLQRQYVQLVAEAFSSGTSLKDLLAKKRAAGETVPTDEEIPALVGLNTTLRLS